VMTAPDYKVRFSDAAAMLNYGFGSCSLYEDDHPEQLQKIAVKKAIEKKASCKFEKNFYYLTKLLPYFMARTNRQDLRQQYLNQIENRLLLEYINEIDTEIRFLEDKEMFDNLEILRGVNEIINNYCISRSFKL